jgi:hypothetical protein
MGVLVLASQHDVGLKSCELDPHHRQFFRLRKEYAVAAKLDPSLCDMDALPGNRRIRFYRHTEGQAQRSSARPLRHHKSRNRDYILRGSERGK